MNSGDKLRCPNCGGADIRHSLPRGIVDWILTMFNKAPVRCRRCERRFYRALGDQTQAVAEHETPAIPNDRPGVAARRGGQ